MSNVSIASRTLTLLRERALFAATANAYIQSPAIAVPFGEVAPDLTPVAKLWAFTTASV